MVVLTTTVARTLTGMFRRICASSLLMTAMLLSVPAAVLAVDCGDCWDCEATWDSGGGELWAYADPSYQTQCITEGSGATLKLYCDDADRCEGCDAWWYVRHMPLHDPMTVQWTENGQAIGTGADVDWCGGCSPGTPEDPNACYPNNCGDWSIATVTVPAESLPVGVHTIVATVDDNPDCDDVDDPPATAEFTITVKPSPPTCPVDENPDIGCGISSGGCSSGCAQGGFPLMPDLRAPKVSISFPSGLAGPGGLGGDFGAGSCEAAITEIVDTCSGFWITGRDACGKCRTVGPIVKPENAPYPWTFTSAFGEGVTLWVTLNSDGGSSASFVGSDGSRRTNNYAPLSTSTRRSGRVGPGAVVLANGSTTTYNRAASGALESVALPNGDQWGYGHAENDTKITRIVPPGGSYPSGMYTDITYSAEGPDNAEVLKTITTYGGEKPLKTEYSYSNGKLSQMSKGYIDGGQFVPQRTVTYVYEGRTITVTETSVTPDIVIEYDYGAEGTATTTVTREHPTDHDQDLITKYQFALDGSNRRTFLEKVTEPRKRIEPEVDCKYTLYSTTTDGRVTSVTDPKGYTTDYAYENYSDAKGTLKLINYPKLEEDTYAAVWPTEEYVYYREGTDPEDKKTVWLRWHKDVRGNYTFYDRDLSSLWRVDAVKVASTAEVTAALGDPLPDEDDTDWTTFWGSSSRTILGQYTYYEDGKLHIETVPGIDGANAQVTEYVYTENGKTRNSPTQVIYQYPYWNGSSWSYTTETSITRYDDAERVLETEDADGRKVWYRYDGLGRLTRTICKWLNGVVDGTPVIYTENHYMPCCGMVDWVRDENGNKTYYEYDALGRTTKMWTDATGQDSQHPLVEYGYDHFGNKTSVTTRSDASTARVRTYTHDNNGRVKSVSYPDSLLGQELFWYDANGNVRFRQDGNGKVTAYEYDQGNRLQHVHYDFLTKFPGSDLDELAAWDSNYWYWFYWDAFDQVHPPDINYAYDGGSSLKTVMDDATTTATTTNRYFYDNRGRLIRYVPSTKDAADYVVAYTYNNAGQKTSIQIGNPSIDDPEAAGYPTCSLTDVVYDISYEYFANGWLRKVKSGAATVAEYEYDEVGNRTRVKLGNGTYTDYALSSTDPRYLTDAIRHYKKLGADPNPATDTLLGKISYAGDPEVPEENRDAMGNPQYIEDWIGAWTYRYDANNRLDWALAPNLGGGTAARPVPDQPAGGDYVYDWVGNRTRPPKGTGNEMVYNAADQLTAWPGTHTYTYWPDGSLKEKKNAAGDPVLASYTYTPAGLLDTASYGGRTLTNTWDGDSNRVGLDAGGTSYSFVYDVTAGIPAVVEDGDGTSSVFYIREPGGELIARKDGSSWSYYHFDELGSTRLLTRADGTVTDRYAYDAYGALLSHDQYSNWVDQPYQYVGQLGYYTHYQEPEFGLLQLGVRFYDAEVGRFTRIDPVRDGINWYGYAGSRPLVATDPSGLICLGSVDCTCLRQPLLCVALGLIVARPLPVVAPPQPAIGIGVRIGAGLIAATTLCNAIVGASGPPGQGCDDLDRNFPFGGRPVGPGFASWEEAAASLISKVYHQFIDPDYTLERLIEDALPGDDEGKYPGDLHINYAAGDSGEVTTILCKKCYELRNGVWEEAMRCWYKGVHDKSKGSPFVGR